MSRLTHRVVGLGGTFDHFHQGHKQFLLYASQMSQKLIIGITDPTLTEHKPFAETIEPYSVRYQAVRRFCQHHQLNVQIVQLHDPFGPTLEKSEIQALCVTPETVPGANKINELRQRLRLRALPVYVCPMFKDDSGQELHSARIRAGEVDRQGRVYAQLFKETVTLTPTQREFFSKPQGEVANLMDTEQFNLPATHISVVGDLSLETFIKAKWPFNLGVFDRHSLRNTYHSEIIDALKPNQKATNPAGEISLQLIKALTTALTKQRWLLEVDGEEDLAAVALFLLTPLGSVVYYGQADVGIIRCQITEEFKTKIWEVLSQK